MWRVLKVSLVAILATLAIACSKVPAGHVGVKVYLLGTDKGVDVEELGVGRYWIGVNEELFLFPTFTQNYVWTADSVEGSENDESITFQTVEGMAVGADVGISYHIDPTKVATVFQKYRKGVEEITDVYLRNMVRDAFVVVTSTRPVEDVYGAGKAEILSSVEEMVRKQTSEIGIVVEKIYLVGQLRLPQQVTVALNAKIEATQKAQQRENEIQRAKAEAQIAREDAQGKGDSALIVANAEAEAIRIKGAALRNNPSIIQLNAVEKWDGVLPRVSGSEVVPFLNVDTAAQ